MFYYLGKGKEVRTRKIKIRDEWGALHKVDLVEGAPRLSDQDLADQLEVSLITVLTHRRDE